MRRFVPLTFALLVAPVVAACTVPFVPDRGSGTVVTEERSVAGFDEVSLEGTGTLTIEQGDREALTIEAEDNIIPRITTEVRGRRLEIGFRRGTSGRPTEPIRFHLTMRDIHAIELAGSGDVVSASIQSDDLSLTISGSGDARIDRFSGGSLRVEISGSGSCTVAGTATDQRVEIAGSGEYRAGDLASETASVDIAGSGDATVRVAQSLDVSVAGSGDVRYYGNPSISQTILGSGNVERAGD